LAASHREAAQFNRCQSGHSRSGVEFPKYCQGRRVVILAQGSQDVRGESDRYLKTLAKLVLRRVNRRLARGLICLKVWAI
jgi:hypothetical protein